MKGVLIIDMPKDCGHCELNIPFSKYNLSCQKTGYANGGDGSIPPYCPLKLTHETDKEMVE